MSAASDRTPKGAVLLDHESVTIIHLSDTQFGQYHTFGEGHESLAGRMLQDLELLGYGPGTIDLVIISGDIAEQAKVSEFRQAIQFVQELSRQINLPPTRFVLVPGNHDVNWHLCSAYHSDCAARDLSPEPPYAPKYEFFLNFIEELTGTRPTNTYGVDHFPDLNLSVARLDSTQLESHETHFGHCGEPQLRGVAAELQENGLAMRIAVVHHNARRKAEADEENLRDADDLARILAPHVSLLLHGHTHDGRIDRLQDGTLVLSTGSAAVNFKYRPDEVSNQYQVLELTAHSVTRRGRIYARDQKRWVPDGRVGGEDAAGTETISIGTRVDGDNSPEADAPAQHSTPISSPPETDRPGANGLSALASHAEIDMDALQAFRNDLRPDSLMMNPSSLSAMELLARLGLARDGALTLAGVLMVGTSPQALLPGAVLQCVRYLGRDKTAPRESLNISGTLKIQMDSAFNFIQERIERRERTTAESVRSTTSYRYPMRCVREVLVNALVHRDYQDQSRNTHLRIFDNRIEIWSAGQWVEKELGSEDTLLHQLVSESVKRNPILARAVANVRYMEGEGSGLATALRDTVDVGAPEPTVRIRDGYVVVTIAPSRIDHELISRAEQAAAQTAKLRESWVFGSGSSRSIKEIYQPPRLQVRGSTDHSELGPREIVALRDRLILVSGAAGSGKTSLLRHLMSLFLERGVLPIMLTSSSLDIDQPEELLATAVLHTWEGLGLEPDTEQLDAILTTHPVAILVDGLDELSPARRTAIKLASLSWLERFPTVRFIMSVRQHELASMIPLHPHWLTMHLLPWSDEEAQLYVSSLIENAMTGSDDPPAFAADRSLLDRIPAEFYRNPLLAQVAIASLARKAPGGGALLEFLNNYSDLLVSRWDSRRRIVGTMLHARHEHRLLAEIAFRAATNGLANDGLPSLLLGAWIRELEPDADSLTLLDNWRSRSTILVETDSADRGSVFTFAHPLLFDYYCAVGAVNALGPDTDALALFVSSMVRDHAQVGELLFSLVDSYPTASLERLVGGLAGIVFSSGDQENAVDCLALLVRVLENGDLKDARTAVAPGARQIAAWLSFTGLGPDDPLFATVHNLTDRLDSADAEAWPVGD